MEKKRSADPAESAEQRQVRVKMASESQTEPPEAMIAENPTLATPTYPDIQNGDCLAFALATARMYYTDRDMVGGRQEEENEALASSFRTEIEQHIQAHWQTPCSPAGGLCYGDLVAMVHNQAIPNTEREQYPDWGESLDDKLAGWLREREQLYWGQAEVSAFVDLMEQKHGQRFTVRVWREFRPKGSPRHLKCLCTTPDAPHWGGRASITIDLRHKGAPDGPTSHYALLYSGHLVATPSDSVDVD